MKFTLVSDLHLDFTTHRQPTLPGGELLIIAGDLCESRSLTVHDDLPHIVRGRRDNVRRFIDLQSKQYTNVICVLGNHEHYHGNFNKTYDTVKSQLPDNFHLLENETIEFDNTVFLCGTLWTDVNKCDAMTIHALKDLMADYKHIKFNTGDSFHKLDPKNTYGVHRRTMEYFKAVLGDPSNEGKDVVMVTHHAPTMKGIDDRYAGSQLLNGGYASDLSEFILDHPQIKVWVHGHTHHRHHYYVGDGALVACNPWGYHYDATEGCREEYSGFEPDTVIDLDNLPPREVVSCDYYWTL